MEWSLRWTWAVSLFRSLFDLRVSQQLSKTHASHLKNMESEPNDLHRTFQSCVPIKFWNEERFSLREVEHQLATPLRSGFNFKIKLYVLEGKMNILGPVYVPPRSTHCCLFSKAWLWPSTFFPNQEGPSSSSSILAVLKAVSCCRSSHWKLRSFNRHHQLRKTNTVATCCPDWTFRSSSGFLEAVLKQIGLGANWQNGWTLTNGRQEMRDH